MKINSKMNYILQNLLHDYGVYGAIRFFLSVVIGHIDICREKITSIRFIIVQSINDNPFIRRFE